MTTPVTIALPVYNNASTVGRAIHSVISQTHSQWNLIVLDDGSSDGSVEVVNEFLTDPRIVLLVDGQNLGLAARLNQAARLCSTELLFRMDADDVMLPERIETQTDFMRAHPEVDVLGSRAYAMSSNTTVLGHFIEPKIGITPADWLTKCGLTHPTLCARTAWHLRFPYDESLRRAEDLELFIRAATLTRFAKLEHELLFYNLRHETLGSYHKTKRAERRVIQLNRFSLSRRQHAGLLVRSILKEIFVASLTLLGGRGFLMRKRYAGMDRSKLEQLQHALDIVGGADRTRGH